MHTERRNNWLVMAAFHAVNLGVLLAAIALVIILDDFIYSMIILLPVMAFFHSKTNWLRVRLATFHAMSRGQRLYSEGLISLISLLLLGLGMETSYSYNDHFLLLLAIPLAAQRALNLYEIWPMFKNDLRFGRQGDLKA